MRLLGLRGLVVLALLPCACAPRLVRTEGRPLAADPPRDSGGARLFVGEGRARDPARAAELAEADARGQALRSIVTDVKSTVESRIRMERLNEVVSIDERAEIDLRSESAGSIEGSRRASEPYLEFYSDGEIHARVTVEFPRESLDLDAFLVRMVSRQALEHRLTGQVEKARDAFHALSQLRPADPVPYLQLARIEEQAARPAEALKLLERARALNGGEQWLALPTGEDGTSERIDLEAEIDRLTPRWENLLAEISRLEELRKDPSFSIQAAKAEVSRSRDKTVFLRLSSRERRTVALAWVDDDGLAFLPRPETLEAAGGPFFAIEGLKTIELDPGTLNATVRVVALAVSADAARVARVDDVGRPALGKREPTAVAAESALRDLLDRESRAGSLEVATTTFEIMP